jgi:hypothetical protein
MGIRGNINVWPYPLNYTDHVSETISCYGQYRKGWSFGEGIPSDGKVISMALEIHCRAKLYGFETEPHLLMDGGINLILSFNNHDHFLSVTINPNYTIDYCYEIGIGLIYETIEEMENINISLIDSKLTEILSRCSSMYEYYPSEAILESNEDSATQPLKNLAEVYQLSISPALIEEQEALPVAI